MKTVVMVLSLFAFLHTAGAVEKVNSKKIAAVAVKLANLLPNSERVELEPASPLEILKEYAWIKMQIPAEEFEYNAESAMQTDSTAFGLIKMSQAISWVLRSPALTEDIHGDPIRGAPEAKKAADLIRSLVGTGVVFGAIPNGATQCGVTFPALVLIDTKTGKLYSFHMEGSGC